MARQVEDVQALTLEEVLAELEAWEKDVEQTESVLETELPSDDRDELAKILESNRAYVAKLRARRDELGQDRATT